MGNVAILQELKDMGVTGPAPVQNPSADPSMDEALSRIQESIEAVQRASQALKLSADQVSEAMSLFGTVLGEAFEETEEEDE